MNMEWIQCFVTAARFRSLTKASEYLHMTQPAVSKQIRKLEEIVGAALLKRSYSGIELTEKGERFLQKAEPMLTSWEKLCEDLIDDDIREVTIATLPYVSNYYMPGIILKLRELSIEVHIKMMNHSQEVLECVYSGGAKLGIVDSQYIESDIWRRDLFKNSYYAILHSSHPLNGNKELTLEELKEEPFVVFPFESDITKNIIKEFESRSWTPQIREIIRFDQAIIPFVGAGAGITILPEIAVNCPFMVMAENTKIVDYSNSTTFAMVSSSDPLGEYISERMLQ